MEKLSSLFLFFELAGTFAFAISGATAAKQRGLDVFGICAIAFTVACGGGIIRDLCIGAIPPAGLSISYYLITALIASGLTIGTYSWVKRINHPVILFDALGLSFFAVTGADKAFVYTANIEAAILLGTTTAVGGGVLRDVLLNRVPIILKREIYASAALVGSAIVVTGSYFKLLPSVYLFFIALILCFLLRIFSLRYQWNLPVPSAKEDSEQSDEAIHTK